MRVLLSLFILTLTFSYACTDAQVSSNPKSKTDEKIEFYKYKTNADPKSYSYHNMLAQSYVQKARETGIQNYYYDAQELLKQSLEISPNNYNGLIYMAVVHGSKHDFHEALKYAKLAVNHYPEKSHAYGVLGDAYLELGQVKKAEKTYNKMVKLEPGLDSYGRLSNLRFKKHEIRGAIKAMEKAYEYGLKNDRTPRENLAWTQVMLGNIYLHEGERDLAEKYFDKALEIMPNNMLAHGNIMESHTHSF